MSRHQRELARRMRDAGERIDDVYRTNAPRPVFDPPLVTIVSGARRLTVCWGEYNGGRRLYFGISQRRGDGAWEQLRDGTFACPAMRLPDLAEALAGALESFAGSLEHDIDPMEIRTK